MEVGVHSFLRQHTDEILRAWQTRVASEDRNIELVGSALRDDVPSLLKAFTDWLEGDEQAEPLLVAVEALKHVMQRLDQGYSLVQVLREYRLLRETIIEAVLGAEADEQARGGVPGEQGHSARIKGLARLNAGLDVVLSQSVVEFVAEQDRRAAEERARAEEALREANEQLRESDRRKTEFLAILSHELRNPLAPIRNSIYLLERAAPDSDQAARAREVVRRQTEHLTRLVDDLLDVTRISHGKIPLERSRLDLREIVRKTTDDLYSVFTQAGINLRVDTSGPMWIEADSTRMAQVLTNLLNNSMKFTPNGGTVRVSVAPRDGRAELCVVDDGIGMDPKDIEHMFEPFAQADQSLARTGGGLGLGLALVKSIVELHGGTVVARSDGPGRGAEFLVRLPLADAAADSEKPRRRNIRTPPRSVLIIEDNVDGAQSLAEILEFHGHRVRVARDGASGIALARELQPDVIICDIGLPDVDGYEVARTLRSDGPLRDTRLVALSGYAQLEDRQRARDAGFGAHLAKPVELDDLLAALAVPERD